MLKRGVSFLVLLAALLLFHQAGATHIRAGEITIERKNCQSLTFYIYVTGYVDLIDGQVLFGGGTLDFGDGTPPIENIRQAYENGDSRIELLLDEVDLGGGNGVGITRFRIEHTYGGNGNYIVSYLEANRNEGILNMDNSVNTTFYVESILRIDPFLGCNNSPVMLIAPIDFGCSGVAFYHNPGAFDQDGDSLAFEFVVPKKNVGTPVDNFRQVNDPEFGGRKEDGSGPATFTIDPITGDIVWDAPGLVGEYNIAFVVREFRKVQGQFHFMGSVVRDMQIIIKDCDNNRPELDIPDDLCVEAGTNIQELIKATDPDGDQVKIEVFSAVLHFPNSPATFQPDPPTYQDVPAQLLFEWQTTCDHIREQPYLVHFKATDKPPLGVALVEFATMNITVVAPSPKGLTSTVNNDRTIDLTWDPYLCTNADSIQIWRRVDSYGITRDLCQTGMPDYAGYTLIDKVPATATSYKDDNGGRKLAFDAKYCYRLVAQFPLPQGGESYVSDETCGIIRADGPAITHVTVDETSETDGKITVSWRGPFEIDQSLFPPPYKYELWRGTGFNGTADVQVMSLSSDTTFQDTGLDTRNNTYFYVVKLFDASDTEIRESVSASQVRLAPTPLLGRIELNWQADIPWTMNSPAYPMHYIYRDNVVAGNPQQLVLIDSVDVTQDGFYYSDDGKIDGGPLNDQIEYCYYVATYGTYGNPQVAAPQINLSQIVCAKPNDTIPPCAPEAFLTEIDCESFLADKDCDYKAFFNELKWRYDNTGSCKDDLAGFNIYFSDSGDSTTYTLVATVSFPDSVFIHTELSSFKGCYYVTALDRSGNESPPSVVVCNDNCPFYKLPNVITPNGDGVNDTFRPLDEESPGGRCPRFVKSVYLRIFNRWGGLLYEYQSGGENSIYINWDGRDSTGKLLPAGTYFYSADVVFDVLNKDEQQRTFTGWVQILY